MSEANRDSAAAPSISGRNRAGTQAGLWVRYAIVVGGLLVLTGYWGPWVDHRTAALVVTGLDLGEYVKFLPAILTGQISLWREGFYLPLVATSLTYSLCAFRSQLNYPWFVRALLIALAIVAALNMLPPAWTPQRMLTEEFRQQLVSILVCLAAMAFSPFLALLPHRIVAALILSLAVLAAVIPGWQFLSVLPDISGLYHTSLRAGWGVYVMIAGLGLLASATPGLWREPVRSEAAQSEGTFG